MGGGEETFSKGGSLAETHHKLIELLTEDIKEEITAWNLPLGDKLWLPAAEALKSNTQCKRLTIYECDIGIGKSRSRTRESSAPSLGLARSLLLAFSRSRSLARPRPACLCAHTHARALHTTAVTPPR